MIPSPNNKKNIRATNAMVRLQIQYRGKSGNKGINGYMKNQFQGGKKKRFGRNEDLSEDNQHPL
jgi:hypothetical protein